LAAGDDDVDTAGREEVVAEHGGLHAGSANLVDGGAGYALGKARAQRGLACRSLALAGLQHVAHDDFVHSIGLDACAFDGCLDGNSTQLVAARPERLPIMPPMGVRATDTKTIGSDMYCS